MTANDRNNARTVQRGTILWSLLKLRDHFTNHGEHDVTGESPLSYQNSKTKHQYLLLFKRNAMEEAHAEWTAARYLPRRYMRYVVNFGI
jgi:hypothetical protein